VTAEDNPFRKCFAEINLSDRDGASEAIGGLLLDVDRIDELRARQHEYNALTNLLPDAAQAILALLS